MIHPMTKQIVRLTAGTERRDSDLLQLPKTPSPTAARRSFFAASEV